MILSDKTCTKCGEIKPTASFSRASRLSSGLSPACKACCKAQNDDWRSRNADHLRAYDAARDKAARAAARRQERVDNGDHVRAIQQAQRDRWSDDRREEEARKVAAWREANPGKAIPTPEQSRVRTLKHRYGLSVAQVDEMVRAQDGCCLVCQRPLGDDINIDHDHACCDTKGKTCGRCVRGVLHRTCNSALGLLGDDPDVLMSAAAYLFSTRSVLGGVPSA